MTGPTSYTGSFLRARALAKVHKFTNDVSPHLESAKQSAAGKLAQLRDLQHDRDAWGDDPRMVKQVKQRQRDYADPTRRDSSISSLSGSSTSTRERSGWIASVSSYFGGGGNGGPSFSRQVSTSAYTDEKVVCFPGWATLRPSAHSASEPALVLEIVAHGYAYRLRPLSQASRSQRVFGSLARSFAALPRLPTQLPPNGQINSTQSMDILPPAEVVKDEALLDGNIFERLLDIGGREGTSEEEAELARATEFAAEPESMTLEEQAKSPFKPGEGQISTHRVALTPAQMHAHLTEDPGQPQVHVTPSSFTSSNEHTMTPPRTHPNRASTIPSTSSSSWPSRASSISSQATTLSSRTAPTRPASPYRDAVYRDEWPKPFELTDSELPRLHSNLQDRLLPFFGQKLPNRKVRLSVVPVFDSETAWDRPLATKVVLTLGGGAFKTVLEMRSKELRRLLEATGKGVESLETLRVRVVAELLEHDSIVDAMGGGAFTGDQGMKVVAEDFTEFAVAHDGGVRVISDVDDTCKHSQVVEGTKTLFRNVFVRELYEVQVPGMASWFRTMEAQRCAFHYVSNSPWELWPVIRAFLDLAKFPKGSVTLKEYGGAGSALAKLWEEPGMRKRDNVENIIKEFYHSQFILIGDSGEQDLELYTQLASEYPDHVLAIYIRDVTTAFSPKSHPDLSHLSSQHPPHKGVDASNNGADHCAHADVKKSVRPPIPPRPSVGSKRPSFLRRGTNSRPSSPPLVDPDSDPLSPNNPLRPTPMTPTVAEEEQLRIDTFYARIAEAEKKLPRGILLKIFRHGKEVEKEALEVIKFGQTGGGAK
ncbi:BQ2448_1675 [Microbotryum intermedium]|uniref:BQ2448_1675 protein n=1 Tax=Microbotryum intermedium TaxID=269621 RepID=A0A238FDT0_9BASI|nr:BQ2448_1675 [Microbotryum intermedium]